MQPPVIVLSPSPLLQSFSQFLSTGMQFNLIDFETSQRALSRQKFSPNSIYLSDQRLCPDLCLATNVIVFDAMAEDSWHSHYIQHRRECSHWRVILDDLESSPMCLIKFLNRYRYVVHAGLVRQEYYNWIEYVRDLPEINYLQKQNTQVS